MRGTESGWRFSARTPLSAVADSKGGNASTGALQVKIHTSQLTVHILKATPRGRDFGLWPKSDYINLF